MGLSTVYGEDDDALDEPSSAVVPWPPNRTTMIQMISAARRVSMVPLLREAPARMSAMHPSMTLCNTARRPMARRMEVDRESDTSTSRTYENAQGHQTLCVLTLFLEFISVSRCARSSDMMPCPISSVWVA